MELRAFAICRSCFETHPAGRYCPHCAADGLAVSAPVAPPVARATIDAELPSGQLSVTPDSPRRSPMVLLGAMAIVLLILAAAVQAA